MSQNNDNNNIIYKQLEPLCEKIPNTLLECIPKTLLENLPDIFLCYMPKLLSDNLPNYGKLFSKNGLLKFEGEMKDGLPNGYGIVFCDKFNKDGKLLPAFVGKVKYEYNNIRSKYSCIPHGFGISFYYNNKFMYPTIYCGNWEDGKFHGYGKLFRSIESKTDISSCISYDGEWYQGYPHGQCISYWKNGNERYNGEWSYGCFHENGTLYYENGKIEFYGKFDYGSYVEGIGYEQDGTKKNIDYKINNSKYTHGKFILCL
jgi:hypothetical protein